MRKTAASMENRDGSIEGGVAGSVGRLVAMPTAALLDPGNFFKFLSGMPKKDAQRVIDTMSKAHPEELKDVLVNLGGTNLVSDFKRLYNSKQISIPEKILGALSEIPTTIGASLNRADHYNPLTNSVTSYSGNPHVLEHELGHAVDFNKRKGLERSLYSTAPVLIGAAGVATGMKPASDAAIALRNLLVEARATSGALKVTKKERPGEAAASRNVLFPAYGSYVGGAGTGLAGLAAFAGKKHLSPKAIAALLIAGAVAPIAGILGGHAVARIYNATHKDAKEKTSSESMATELEKISKVLTTSGRKHVAEKNFALPGGRYPIHDSAHARNALARVAQHGTPSEQARVRAAVEKSTQASRPQK